MKATRIRELALMAVLAGVVSWVAVREFYGSLPQLRWFVPLSLVLLGIAEAVAGSNLRARVQRRPGALPVDPIVAARQLALAKASAIVGALMVGAWAGLLVYALNQLDYLAAADNDAITAGIGVGSAAALVAGALWLEYCCRTPKPPDEAEHQNESRPV